MVALIFLFGRAFISRRGDVADRCARAARQPRATSRRADGRTAERSGIPRPHRAFQEELEKLGWIVGRNLTIAYRWPAGDLARTYYADDPVRTAATLYRRHDAAPLLAYIARALGQETATPTPR
jgi:hypothetical protein